MIRGSTSSASVSPPARTLRSSSITRTKIFQAEQTVYDGWHAGQVGDVDAEYLGKPAALRVLLQVHRRRHAQHEGRDARNAHHVDAAYQGREYACLLGGGARDRM